MVFYYMSYNSCYFWEKYRIEDIFNKTTNNSQNTNIGSNVNELSIKESNNKKWYKKIFEKLLNFLVKNR